MSGRESCDPAGHLAGKSPSETQPDTERPNRRPEEDRDTIDIHLSEGDFDAARACLASLPTGRLRSQTEALVDILQWHTHAPRRALGLAEGAEVDLRHIKALYRCRYPDILAE